MAPRPFRPSRRQCASSPSRASVRAPWPRASSSPSSSSFDPLVTWNPTLERELEVNIQYEKGAEGKEVEAEVEVRWRFGDRIEASVEIPVVFLMPREGSDEAGWATSRSAARC